MGWGAGAGWTTRGGGGWAAGCIGLGGGGGGGWQTRWGGVDAWCVGWWRHGVAAPLVVGGASRLPLPSGWADARGRRAVHRSVWYPARGGGGQPAAVATTADALGRSDRPPRIQPRVRARPPLASPRHQPPAAPSPHGVVRRRRRRRRPRGRRAAATRGQRGVRGATASAPQPSTAGACPSAAARTPCGRGVTPARGWDGAVVVTLSPGGGVGRTVWGGIRRALPLVAAA